MKTMIATLSVFLYASTALAMLPPKYQNADDLSVMTGFVKKHDRVMETLKSIDFANYAVYFGDDCKAVFGRKAVPKPQGWVGPADRLEFKSSNCDLKLP